jgi:hypothetical protein
LFGLGKGTVIKKLKSSPKFVGAVRKLNEVPLSQCDVRKAGELALLEL